MRRRGMGRSVRGNCGRELDRVREVFEVSARSPDSRARRGTAGRTTTDRYTRSLLDYRHRATEHEVAWIDELIHAERSAAADRPEGATA